VNGRTRAQGRILEAWATRGASAISQSAIDHGPRVFGRVGIDWTPDPLEARLRFGLVALATDLCSETELHRILPVDSADLFVSRVHHTGACDVASLRAMAAELESATGRLVPGTPLDAVAYGCTSGAVAIGADRVAEAIHSQRPGVTVATPLPAALAAFATLDIRRVAVLTPYIGEVNEMIVDQLERDGIDVARLATFNLNTDEEFTAIPPEAIERAVMAMDLHDVDAVFVSCTALRSALAIEPLERALGLPVITSNQAMLWRMMVGSGYDRPVRGFGRLLEHLS
jgi:maleate isomerase